MSSNSASTVLDVYRTEFDKFVGSNVHDTGTLLSSASEIASNPELLALVGNDALLRANQKHASLADSIRTDFIQEASQWVGSNAYDARKLQSLAHQLSEIPWQKSRLTDAERTYLSRHDPSRNSALGVYAC